MGDGYKSMEVGALKDQEPGAITDRVRVSHHGSGQRPNEDEEDSAE